MKKLLTFAIFVLLSCYCFGQVVVQQQQLVVNPVVIERTEYIEIFRTVYRDRPQPTRTARRLQQPVQLAGFLWVFSEDLGNFRQHPHEIIRNVNVQNPHGRNNWRIPTHDELMLMEANADRIGLGSDIYMATSHSNGVLRLVSTGRMDDDIISSGEGVEMGGIIWATSDVGRAGTFVGNPNVAGNLYTWENKEVCPSGWRLPTPQEFEVLARFSRSLDGDVVVLCDGKNKLFFAKERGGIWYWHQESAPFRRFEHGQGVDRISIVHFVFNRWGELEGGPTVTTFASPSIGIRVRCVR